MYQLEEKKYKRCPRCHSTLLRLIEGKWFQAGAFYQCQICYHWWITKKDI